MMHSQSDFPISHSDLGDFGADFLLKIENLNQWIGNRRLKSSFVYFRQVAIQIKSLNLNA
ncbi:hypothetical protein [Algoriphagus boritolerans]|uniref:hypothetical protein n=1 Tax=Algoriphagus boritolerans TaxID=308111 RepID=UPI002FCE16C8